LRGPSASRVAGASIGAAIFAAVAVASAVPGMLAATKPVPVWPTIAQWDLAAVSIAENRNLFPPRWADPALTLPQLRAAFDPATNTSLYVSAKVTSIFQTPMAESDFPALRRAWLALPVSYPRAYAAHRLRVAGLMFGWDRAAHPDFLVLSPQVVAYADNPPVAMNASPGRVPVQDRLQSWINTPLFAGWIHGLVAALVVFAAGLDHRRAGAGLATAIAASGLLLALPLVVLSPSTDFRYLDWLLAAALMAPLAWFFARPGKRSPL